MIDRNVITAPKSAVICLFLHDSCGTLFIPWCFPSHLVIQYVNNCESKRHNLSLFRQYWQFMAKSSVLQYCKSMNRRPPPTNSNTDTPTRFSILRGRKYTMEYNVVSNIRFHNQNYTLALVMHFPNNSNKNSPWLEDKSCILIWIFNVCRMFNISRCRWFCYIRRWYYDGEL